MPGTATSENLNGAIWDRVMSFEKPVSPTAARALLKLQFSDRDRERMARLAEKSRASTLTLEEERESDT